jgi:hypothetical protein
MFMDRLRHREWRTPCRSLFFYIGPWVILRFNSRALSGLQIKAGCFLQTAGRMGWNPGQG